MTGRLTIFQQFWRLNSFANMVSILDELQDFKQRMKALQLDILSFEKVGNGNMSAFKMRYRLPGSTEEHEHFFWRHDMDRFEEKLKEAIAKVL